ncbi:MAG: ABC transporter ATP-binding protein [Rhodoglobus sp.]
MITVQNATKRYGANAVVDDVSIELGGVGVTAIIGPNGAGKSTLLSMIGRLLAPTSGSILIDGMDVASTPGSVLAKSVAVLRQDNQLTARLTVRELIGFGRFPHSRGRLTAVDRDAIDAAIEYLDLGEFSSRYLDELSGGQRQRAFIAMVIAQDTKYVLLDEPLNSLDLKHAVDIMRLLKDAAEATGKRILIVLHDINFASTYADEIVAMEDGRIHTHGAAADVMQPEVLSALYGLPVAVEVIGGQRIGVYYG